MRTAQFKETTEEAVRASRLALGVAPDFVADLDELTLPVKAHSYVAIDGSRWSNEGAMELRNAYLEERRMARVA